MYKSVGVNTNQWILGSLLPPPNEFKLSNFRTSNEEAFIKNNASQILADELMRKHFDECWEYGCHYWRGNKFCRMNLRFEHPCVILSASSVVYSSISIMFDRFVCLCVCVCIRLYASFATFQKGAIACSLLWILTSTNLRLLAISRFLNSYSSDVEMP